MGSFYNFKTRIASRIVIYYYNKAYKKAVAKADERHKKEGETIYVIDGYIKGQLLSVINRKQFRAIKHAAQRLHKNPMFWSWSYGTKMLREQCWYHTADGSESDALSAKDIEIRRIAFLRKGLKKARLVK